MNAQERVFGALNELGVDVSYLDANKWIKKTYGEGVTDASFYNSRKAYKLRHGTPRSEGKGTPQGTVPLAQCAEPGVTLVELQKVASFAKEVGGRARLAAILDALEGLTA